MYKILSGFFSILLLLFMLIFKDKEELAVEVVALRQQLGMFLTKKEKPKITDFERAFLVAIKCIFSKWKNLLVVVKPETVVKWQQRRFKSYWRRISAHKTLGRKPIDRELRQLIKRMRFENHWGASKIYSELLKLGFTEDDLSQPTVSRYLRKFRKDDPDYERKTQSWRTFLQNSEGISAMDFFTVPTVNFTILYVHFIIDHSRRKIVHFNVTEHPYSDWVIQQLREAFPFDEAPNYLIFDRDSIFSAKVRKFIKSMGITPVVTSYQSPWQNGIAERFVQSIKHELLNNVIIFNRKQLYRLVKEYVDYYNNDRCHLGVGRDSPSGRKVQKKQPNGKVVAIPRLGGLVHKYEWKDTA